MTKEAEVKEIIANQLGINHEQLCNHAVLASLKEWDSLKAIRILTSIESCFGKKIPLVKFIAAKTVNDIVSLVA